MTDPCYILRSTETGKFSHVFYSREELDKFVNENTIFAVEIGLMTFTRVCEIPRPQIIVPWEEGLGSLKSRYEQSGSGEAVPALVESAVRSPSNGQAGAAPGSKKRVRKRSLLPPDGGLRD